jgi:hypothetical protein
MQGGAVGLYCAVVERFDLLVSMRTLAARETQEVFNERAESLRTWLGALNLGLGEGWQRESENRAARPMGVHPRSFAVGIDDGAADLYFDPRRSSRKSASTSRGGEKARGYLKAKGAGLSLRVESGVQRNSDHSWPEFIGSTPRPMSGSLVSAN